jgi:hypothetical protein
MLPADQQAVKVFTQLIPGQVSEKPYGSSLSSWRRDPAADDLAMKQIPQAPTIRSRNEHPCRIFRCLQFQDTRFGAPPNSSASRHRPRPPNSSGTRHLSCARLTCPPPGPRTHKTTRWCTPESERMIIAPVNLARSMFARTRLQVRRTTIAPMFRDEHTRLGLRSKLHILPLFRRFVALHPSRCLVSQNCRRRGYTECGATALPPEGRAGRSTDRP